MPAKRKQPPESVRREKKKVVSKRSKPAAPTRAAPAKDEELQSDDDDEQRHSDGEPEAEEEETADEKRLRLARAYLSKLKADEHNSSEGEGDSDDSDEDAVERRLAKDSLQLQGKTYKYIAADLKTADAISVGALLRGHKLPVTCVAITGDESTAFSGSKDSSICQYDVATGKLVHKYAGDPTGETGHKGHVLALAVSHDGQFLASGGTDNLIRIWDPRTHKEVDALKGHRDVVTSLAFQMGTHQLYSGSKDRTIKLWNIDEMGYMETLYGHATPVSGLHVLRRERVVSVGEDRTLRVWKIAEETQLILRGHEASIDCVCILDDQTFFSGSQDGSLCLWSPMKKKPARTWRMAHGDHRPWISAVAACSFTDLLASGSTDGNVRFWKTDGNNSFEQCGSAAVPGIVNALAFGSTGRVLVAGVGQEHRLGRWQRCTDSRNGIRIIRLSVKHDEAE